MTEKSIRVMLVALELFVGLGAVAGGIGVVTKGIELSLGWLKVSPFRSHAIPDLVLTVVVGDSQFVAAVDVPMCSPSLQNAKEVS